MQELRRTHFNIIINVFYGKKLEKRIPWNFQVDNILPMGGMKKRSNSRPIKVIIVSGFAAFKLLEVLFILFLFFLTETTTLFNFSHSADAFKGSGLIDNRWY